MPLPNKSGRASQPARQMYFGAFPALCQRVELD
jgi:hypothetical protein